MLVAATAVLLASALPALAQDAAPPVENEVVGPPQLRDFSINGTVTREAPETPVQAPPQQRQERTTTTTERPAADAARPSRASSEPTETRAERRTSEPAERPARAEAEELPPPTPASTRSDEAPAAAASQPMPQPTFAPASAEAALAHGDSSVPILPWLLAALGLAGAAAWYFLRQRPRESYAGGVGYNAFQRSPPSPAPRAQPRAAPPAPRPAAPVPRQSPASSEPSEPKPVGVVSTRLRPWLELEFKPDRAVVDEQKAAVAFELSVYNSGSAPAREVLLEASLFNAGPVQDQQLRLFFENPVAKGDRIAVIAPLQRVAINTAVFLPRDQVKPIEVEGRTLFVPLIAFNALYRWSGGEGQTSASYLVGKDTGAEKLGPFRVDQGPRIFRKLAAREHDVRLRK